MRNSLEDGFERAHLRSIPISPAACPAVRTIHVAANRFQRAYPNILPVSGGREWERARARLADATDELTFVIAGNRGRFPRPVRTQLDIVLTNLQAGRTHLTQAKDGMDLLTRASKFDGDGRTAFGYASDLVGDQCDVRLEADVERAFLAPTTKSQRAAPRSGT
jgi:hypothetical protein